MVRAAYKKDTNHPVSKDVVEQDDIFQTSTIAFLSNFPQQTLQAVLWQKEMYTLIQTTIVIYLQHRRLLLLSWWLHLVAQVVLVVSSYCILVHFEIGVDIWHSKSVRRLPPLVEPVAYHSLRLCLQDRPNTEKRWNCSMCIKKWNSKYPIVPNLPALHTVGR